jgi:hypothetical protein
MTVPAVPIVSFGMGFELGGLPEIYFRDLSIRK